MMGDTVHQHISSAVYRAVDQLSVTQTAVIGGVGSGASAVSVLSLDGESWLQFFTLACGAVGALLSIGLLVLKFVQQRREMTKWRTENEIEHGEMRAAHAVSAIEHAESAIDRGEMRSEIEDIAKDSEHLHREINALRSRCKVCGNFFEQ